jgi:hypothetical protein
MQRMSPNLAPLIEQHKHLFWWVPSNKLADLSTEAVVEAVLSSGDEKSVGQLFDILSTAKTAEIFYRQTSSARTNSRPRTIHFFNLYFGRHVQRNSDNKPD